jgi:hypothetical protein
MWSNWASIGGNTVDLPSVANNEDGRLEVFARGPGGDLQHIWQTAPNNGWSDWDSLGFPFAGGYVPPYYIAVGQNEDGRLEVFITLVSNELWHIWQT